MAPSRKSPRPLAATRGIEATKFRDYKSFAEERGGKFLPFVMESLGAFGKHTGEILKSLSKAATTVTLAMSPSEFLQFAKQALSVALQRGNGLVAKAGALNARAKLAATERASRAR